MLKLILLLILAFGVYQYLKNSSEAVANWNHLFLDLQIDPKEFYQHVEELLAKHNVPEIDTYTTNIKQGGALSHNRIYLQVSRKDYTFHICAAPWGNSFFFSWWMREKLSDIDSLLNMIPFLGPKIVRFRQYKSYYKLDTDIMFRQSVHQCIMEAIDMVTEKKGIKALSELERQPDLRLMK